MHGAGGGATKFTIHILAAVAEFEREAISKGTKEGLAAAKAKGKVLGNYERIAKAKQEASKARAAAPLPVFIAPELATLVENAPKGEGWLHEIKLDGYRTAARIERRDVRVLTRSGLDWTARFRPIAGALAALPVKSAYLDGEVAIFRVGSGGFILQRYYQKDWAENFMMQLMVDDLDAWWAHINRLDLTGRFGVPPPRAPELQPWGLRVAYLTDPSGVLWHVAQRREGAAQD